MQAFKWLTWMITFSAVVIMYKDLNTLCETATTFTPILVFKMIVFVCVFFFSTMFWKEVVKDF